MIPKLMLVDDSRADRRLYEIVAEGSGLVGEMLCFAYAEEALAYLRREDRAPVDAILLDINMPRMSGFDFLEAAGEAFGSRLGQMVVVMLTTSLDPADVERSERFEIVKHFFSKPLTVDHLRRIASTLRAHETLVR